MPDALMTERLILTPVDPADTVVIEQLFAIQSDPATWTHLPQGVETDISQTRSMVEDYARSWKDFGLAWWAVGLRAPLADLPTGTIVGLGGAAVRRPAVPAWNLGYRLTPAVWGHGLATEIGRAAREAARVAQPELPVTARALTRNRASWRTLERVGLSLVWEGDAPANDESTSGVMRRVYSDRPLSDGLLDQLVALG